ncbi:MAG TPA: FAD-dependent oxidoreductase [Polyangia bacterium]
MSATNRRVLILGGGISGIALASELDEDVEIVELRERTGGLCETIVENGFTYDAAGPHIMFSKNKAVLQLMVAALGKNVHQKKRENKIWFKGRMVRYPFENDLAALPPEDNFECIHGYLSNPRQGETPTNLAHWSYVTFGKGISEKYFIPYNEKIWNYDAEKIGLEFVSRIPKPPLEDVLRSSIGIPTEGYLHQLYFSYPIEGGFEAIVDAFAARLRGKLRTGWRVARVERDGDGWRVASDRGEEIRCETLVSTIPIHELLKVWPGAPDAARAAAGRLRWNSLINVVIGSAEPPAHGYTAVYVPDPEILFHRVSFPHAFSERCAPEGSSIAMAEITANAGDGVWEMSDEALLARVTADLERAGLVTPSKVSYRRVVRFNYGYPVYDLDYRHHVTELRAAVASTGLRLLGRFAQFDYINSDVCVERALAMAGELRRG